MDPVSCDTDGGANEIVPGDGLYEKGMKKEAEEGFGGETEKAGPVEQDTVMADVTPTVA